jgi:hypothetical protein
MNQFIEDKRRHGRGVTMADGLVTQVYQQVVQADCLIVPIGRLSF